MSEQKQSLADFVFENKDKMPDNVYKILMEQYAKEDTQKGFVEVEYFEPKVKKDGDAYRLNYKKSRTIVRKYDDRYPSGWKEIKIGNVPYGRVCPHPYAKNDSDAIFNNIHMLNDLNVSIKEEDDDDGYSLEAYEVIVTSIKQL
jgi:hypothetical protein